MKNLKIISTPRLNEILNDYIKFASALEEPKAKDLNEVCEEAIGWLDTALRRIPDVRKVNFQKGQFAVQHEGRLVIYILLPRVYIPLEEFLEFLPDIHFEQEVSISDGSWEVLENMRTDFYPAITAGQLLYSTLARYMDVAWDLARGCQVVLLDENDKVVGEPLSP